MAFEFLDSFALGSAAAVTARYDSGSIDTVASTAPVRTGQYAVMSGHTLIKHIRARTDIVMGVGVYWNSGFTGPTEIIQLQDSAGNLQLTLKFNADGTFGLWRGDSSTGTLLATSAAISAGFWVYLELKAIIHASLGSYEFRVNEQSMFSGTGANTKNTALTNVGRVKLYSLRFDGPVGSDLKVDDLYIADLSQPIPASGFYGNRRIEALFPNAFGAVTGFTPFGNASNWQNVDENPHTSDTDYNYASTVNTSDLYGMQNLSTPNGTNVVAQLTHVSRKDDALARVVAPLIRSGGVTYAGENDSLTTSYVYYPEIWNFNPNTSDYFTLAAINAIEAGIQVKF